MKITALAGGVGGAKLVDGFARVLPHEELVVVVNTGDDFYHWGLRICPDLDTVCYTLAGIANHETGWGRANETWLVYQNIARQGGESWFRIGDKDIGTHIIRTHKLLKGKTLSQITSEFCQQWGIKIIILPMTNDPMPTIVDTQEHGWLAFQEYFVRLRCEPRVRGFAFENSSAASPAPGVLEAIADSDAIIICPSNPWVSIDPILSIPGIRQSIENKSVVAVSPIIGGQTVKGPAAKMYSELGIKPSAIAIANHYHNLITGLVIDNKDQDLVKSIRSLGISVLVTNTLMITLDDRSRLAGDVLNFIQENIEK